MDKSWKLIWSDEFKGRGAPDARKWEFEEGLIRNAEAQFYTNRRENVRQEKGSLVIEARKEAWRGSPFTSASIQTRRAFTYGRYEIRAKLPTGRGMWPAIWMLGASIDKVGWPRCGELDIMENVGFDPERMHATIHTNKYNHVKGTQKAGTLVLPRPWADFHVYAMEWDAKTISFFIDDKPIFVYENEGGGLDAWPFDAPHHLKINLAVGGGWGGQKGIDESIFPQRYYIDYVRIYEPRG